MTWWRRRPLSTQLLVIVIVLGGLALAAAGTAASAALRSYLQNQIDQQLVQVTRADRSGPGSDDLPMPPGFVEPRHGDDDDDDDDDHRRNPPGEFQS